MTTTPKDNPLPAVVHAQLTAEQIGAGRVIVIGDIHGCSRELADLLDKCEYSSGTDVIVSVGDLVGKGPNSCQVLQDAQRLGVLTVRGNWEENALAAFQSHAAGSAYEEDVAYMQQMPFSLSIPSHGCIVAHAGLVPGIPLHQQQLYDLIEMRHVDLVDPATEQAGSSGQWKALPKFPREAGKPWATVWPGPQHIIFGHHARRRLQPCSFASGIDTGCCLGDQLTALVLPPLEELRARNWVPPRAGVTREDLGATLVSVPARQKYVKDDKD